MSLFARPERRVATLTTLEQMLRAVGREPRSVRSTSMVTPEQAMRLSAVWACIDLYARTSSTMPIDVVRVSGDERIPMTSPPIIMSPSSQLSPIDWLYALVSSMLLRGNGYGFVTQTTSDGRWPVSIELLDPACVTWRQNGDGWSLLIDGEAFRRWPLGPVWHVPWKSTAGYPFGLSPVEVFRQTIGQGLAAEEFGLSWFDDGAHPSAILAPDRDPGAEGAKHLKDSFMRAVSGSREPVVLPQSVKYERIQVSAEESQFLETQRFSVEQIARIYGLSPEMIGGAVSGGSVTYANREQRAADFLAFSLGPLLAKLEEALSALLPRPQRVKFNTGALLRADLVTRFGAYETAARIQQATGQPLLTVEEMRAFEDLPPLEASMQGGDE